MALALLPARFELSAHWDGQSGSRSGSRTMDVPPDGTAAVTLLLPYGR